MPRKLEVDGAATAIGPGIDQNASVYGSTRKPVAIDSFL